MRLIHVLVPEEREEDVLGVLDERDVDYVVITASGVADGGTLVEFPLPTDAVSDVLGRLHEAGLDEESYIVVGTAETAETSTMELLENRYASDFSPLATDELRSKSRDMSRDPYSFVWMIILSAVIAAGGLLIDSPAVVVGSMVIAPLVGPILTTGVGVVTGDRKMVADSVGFQVGGLVVAVVAATLFSFFLRLTGFAPVGLDVSSLELVTVRLAPTLITVAIGLAAGSAAAFALTTEGPTALVGVMIAAALLPGAATVGIALVWGALVVALGAALLLAVTVLVINAAVIVTLQYLGYRSDGGGSSVPSSGTGIIGLVVLVVVVGGVLFGTYHQLSFERETTSAVEDVLSRPAYGGLDVVAVRTEYDAPSGSRTVTVTLSRTSNRSYPTLARDIQRRIAARTGRSPEVRVRYRDYQVAEPRSGYPSNGSSGS
ncbi:TIGR00341 family protein [Haladaptatus salinisoli]|uniref:TIGR00341 family protein n=1 Tax=Haladaptatus salinisoli TaxID=2884876 RepID=UPI001D0ACD2F|nr:TIGR00341 family protein [Haladaptatus salinisoli]